MKNTSKILILALLLGFAFCKKDKKTDPVPTPVPVPTTVDTSHGKLNIEFENVAGTNALQFNTNYVNAKGDTFKVSKFNYFISNIVITKNDNSTFTEIESYHLIEHSNPSTSIVTLTNVPKGSYKSISFTLGVDSARNTAGAQNGALSQTSGMYWSWTSGYIMFKLEGTAPKSAASGKALIYHIGGYGGANKAQRNFTFNFASTTANVSAAIKPQIHLQADVLEFFKTPNLIDVSTQNFQMSSNATAKMYANNYADLIRFEHVHN